MSDLTKKNEGQGRDVRGSGVGSDVDVDAVGSARASSDHVPHQNLSSKKEAAVSFFRFLQTLHHGIISCSNQFPVCSL